MLIKPIIKIIKTTSTVLTGKQVQRIHTWSLSIAPCTSKSLLSAGQGRRSRLENRKSWNSYKNLANLSGSTDRMSYLPSLPASPYSILLCLPWCAMMNAWRLPAWSLAEIKNHNSNDINNDNNMNIIIMTITWINLKTYVCYYCQQSLCFLQGCSSICQEREYLT